MTNSSNQIKGTQSRREAGNRAGLLGRDGGLRTVPQVRDQRRHAQQMESQGVVGRSIGTDREAHGRRSVAGGKPAAQGSAGGRDVNDSDTQKNSTLSELNFAELERLRQDTGLGINAFLKQVGLSKSTYYRRKGHGRRQANRQAQIEPVVRKLCNQLPAMGHSTIAALLNRDAPKASESTVFRLMKRLKLLPPKPRRKRKKAQPTAPPDQAAIGLTVGLDFTHWKGVPICNVLEYQSRFCLASIAVERETAEAARDTLRTALTTATRLGMPKTKIEIKSDHGATFTAEVFEDFIKQRGCWHTLSAVGRPQGMGRVERFNRSSKEQGLRLTDTDSREELQTELDRYRKFYNQRRPHRALGGATPRNFVRAAH